MNKASSRGKMALVHITFAVLCFALPVYSQDLSNLTERPKAIPPDASWGNKDYFNYYRGPRHESNLLYRVEKNHFNEKENFGAKFSSGKLDDALAELKYVLWVFPNHPNALYFLGLIARLVNLPAVPIAYYQKALKLFPQHAITHAQFGAYLVDSGAAEAGITKLKEAISKDAHLAVAYAWLVKAYEKSGQPELARQAAAQAREFGYRGMIHGKAE